MVAKGDLTDTLIFARKSVKSQAGVEDAGTDVVEFLTPRPTPATNNTRNHRELNLCGFLFFEIKYPM